MSEWVETTLGDVGRFIRGRRFTKSEYVSDGLGCIHYGQLHTHFGSVATESLTFLPMDSRGRLRLAAPGDVVIAATSENTEDLGKATAWLGSDDVAVHDDCYIYKHDLDPRFASHLFASQSFHRQKIQYAAGTKVTRISAANLAKIQVTIPPLSDQRRIADVVGAVDRQVESLQEEGARLDAAYSNALSLLWLETDGEEATVRILGDVMRLDIERRSLVDNQSYSSAGVLGSGQGLVEKGSFRGSETEYQAMNVLRTDQVVMRKLTAWEGPITVVPPAFDGFVASNEFPTFTLSPEASPRWMRHVCRSVRLWDEMKNRVTGSVQRRKRLNPEQLLALALPTPSVESQQRSAAVLDALDAERDTSGAELRRLRMFRSALLTSLLSRDVEIPESYDSTLKEKVA